MQRYSFEFTVLLSDVREISPQVWSRNSQNMQYYLHTDILQSAIYSYDLPKCLLLIYYVVESIIDIQHKYCNALLLHSVFSYILRASMIINT